VGILMVGGVIVTLHGAVMYLAHRKRP
jgi:hypothetical protein